MKYLIFLLLAFVVISACTNAQPVPENKSESKTDFSLPEAPVDAAAPPDIPDEGAPDGNPGFLG